MARYRKCPRPCAQAQSCKWMSKMLQQVPPLKCPYFLKNVSSFMLWRRSNPCPRLEIPADFVQAHGDKFNDMVEVRGPCKSTWYMRVNILICKHRRVMLDRGWRTLVNDLGLNQYDHVLFVLTAFSKFKIYVFDDVGIRRRESSFQARYNGKHNHGASPSAASVMRPPTFSWTNENQGNTFRGRRLSTEQALRDDEGEEEGEGGEEQGEGEEGEREGGEEEEEGATTYEPWKRRLRRSSVARPVVVDLSDDNCQESSESEYTLKGSEVQLENTDSFLSSQRSAYQKNAVGKVPSRSPSFIKKVPALSLRNESGPNCAHLEVPSTFTQCHDDLFNEYITLQGPTGRNWHVMCQITVQQQYRKVKLKAGWFDFAVDNMVKLHDQLLFTHVAEGQFRVQIVTKVHCRRGRPRRNYSSEAKVHQDDARMIRKDQMGTTDTPRSNNFQQPVSDGEYPLKSRIHEMQQQLLAQRRTLYKKIGDRCTSRRGRMEWGLGHS